MRREILWLVAALLVLAGAQVSLNAAVQGDYVEVRSADVYTGPCFANSEESLEGKQAILAWHIKEGNWRGIGLDGLTVVAVVKANATLGDIYHDPYPASSVLIVDERATAPQRRALTEFVRSNAGPLVANIVRIDTAPIAMEVGDSTHHGSVKLLAGRLARVETRSLCEGDHLCGNEEVYYPPLTRVTHFMPAFTLDESFQGQGLGVVWNRADKRSAFVGSFSL